METVTTSAGKSFFRLAKKEKTFLKLAISGPSGSGKTYSSLVLGTELATRLGGMCACIDSENGSAELYADRFNFAVHTIHPALTETYIQSVTEAEQNPRIKVLVIDSLSHQWTNLLERKSAYDARNPQVRGNSFTSWSIFGAEHQRLVDKITSAKVHIISTLRSKTAYMQTEENGRKKIIRTGEALIQRDNMEYEFTTLWELGSNNMVIPTKDRTGLFSADKPERISSQTAGQLLQWLDPAQHKAQPGQGQSHDSKEGAA